MAFIKHNLIKKDTIEARQYQETIAATIIEKGNTLVVAPTALGKTIVAVLLAAHKLQKNPNGKILFLAPTKPLVLQHEKSFKQFLEIPKDKIISITGTTKPEEREQIYKEKTIINATPQTIENDILNSKINLKNFELVIFDECLKGDTKILLNTGLEKPIKTIVKEYFEGKEFFVKSFDEKQQSIVSRKVIAAQKIPCIKPMLKFQTPKQSICCTEDHKLFVKRKNKFIWTQAKNIQIDDELSFYPALKQQNKPNILVTENDIVKLYSKEQQNTINLYYKTMGLRKKFEEGPIRISKQLNYSSRQVENWIYKDIKPKPVKAINSMKKLGLMPFNTNFPNIEIIAKLMGHIYGDGWISKSQQEHYIIGFSGQINDLKNIQEDLKILGIKFSQINSRKTKSKIGKNNVVGQSNSFTCSRSNLTRLMVLLGAPVGSKTNNKIYIPKWILKGSKSVQKAFLSSYFGSEGTQIKEKQNSMSFYPTRISLNQVEQIKENGKKFLYDLGKLLQNFDIENLGIIEREGNIRKDGTKTIKLVLTLSNSTKNQLNFFQNISFSYAIKKEKKARKVVEYLLLKKMNIENKNALKKQTLKLKQQGFSNHKISKMLQINKSYIEKWIYREKEKNCVSLSLPKFDSYSGHNLTNIKSIKIKQIKRIKKEDFVYDLTIDETHNFIANGIITHNCHRATGDYSYVFINKQLQKQNPSSLVVALTASPGGDEEKIQEVCKNLNIQNIEIKNSTDSDVKEYVNEISIDWIKVDLPKEFVEIKNNLEKFQQTQLNFLKEIHVAITANKKYYNRIRILEMQRNITRAITSGKNPSMFMAASKCAALLKIAHAEELIETQGTSALKNYFDKIQDDANKSKSKAATNIVASESIQKAIKLTNKLYIEKIQHPKYKELKKIILTQLKEKPESKILVFNQYRDSIKAVVDFLKDEKEIKVSKFIGQATKGSDKGMTQKIQQQTLEELKNGKFNVLIASSVAEEGLDIPAVEMVIFFEPVPSEIRTIQRRGRTGRKNSGKNIILMTKGTRDEAYYWASKAKETNMKNTLSKIKGTKLAEQSTLNEFMDKKKVEKEINIFVDSREQASSVTKNLFEKECKIIMKQLTVGDYILSKDVCVERKTMSDFLSSMLDGRLFTQLVDLRENYPKPLIILEGEIDELFTLRNIKKESIMGALTSIVLDYQVPIIYTKNNIETANYLFNIAKREQIGQEKEMRLRIGRKGLTLTDQQQFIVEGLPLVGPALAKNMLKEFKTIKNIANASESDLQKIENLGKTKAKKIRKIFDAEYKHQN